MGIRVETKERDRGFPAASKDLPALVIGGHMTLAQALKAGMITEDQKKAEEARRKAAKGGGGGGEK